MPEIRKILRKITRSIIKHDGVWMFFDRTVNRISDYAVIQRQMLLEERVVALAQDRGVLGGPFAGMRYGNRAFGSRLWPKLLGTYESELHPVISALIRNPPDCIIDIGCAEGYYAVGLAMNCVGSHIHAYDTADEARALTAGLAGANGVSGRVTLHGEFKVGEAAPLWEGKSCFILCDTDGAETEIFDKPCIHLLRDCALLIETHDYLREGITSGLLSRFAATHDSRVIQSHCDYADKSMRYRTSAFRESNRMLRGRFFEEGRPAPQQWIHLVPKSRR